MNNLYFEVINSHSIDPLCQKSGVTDYKDFTLGNLSEPTGHK